MKNVFDEIVQWARDLPYWEQAALHKVMVGKPFDDRDYEELLQYLLEYGQLAQIIGDRKPLPFQKGSYENQDQNITVILREISELENVNALVPHQRLTFGENLTAIFGLNASGKSGYARVLGSAGFTRGDREVLPDVTLPVDENLTIKAAVKVDIGGTEKIISHEIGNPCSELSSLYVFDSTSVKVHMTGKNTFSFSPAGLSILTKLSKETDEVRNRLMTKIENLEKPGDFEKYFSGASEIKELVENLGPETDIEKLKSFAKLNTGHETRIHELEIEIGKIGLGRTKEDVIQKKYDLDALRRLRAWLADANKKLNQQSIEEINQLIRDYQRLKDEAKELSVEHFQHERITQTGTELWSNFMQAAHELAQAESQDEKVYPHEGDVCLLCQQPLSANAQRLIRQLWAYLTGQVRSDLRKIEDELNNRYRMLDGENQFSLSEDFTATIALLNKARPEFGNRIEGVIIDYVKQGRKVLSSIELREIVMINDDTQQDCSQDILAFIEQLEKEVADLENLDLVTQTEKLESERQMLDHRKRLKELLPQIEEYVNQRIWARAASKVGGSTRHITLKYDDLFDELVKNRYVEIFEKTLSNMGRPLQIVLVTSGRKGETVKQLQLKVHETAEGIADPEKVLSEGEKRAIALADFLTEAALDTNCSGIVLDDPVSSLDLEWRRTIAEILAKEAEKRQVIVFTHDMPFLYFLLKSAEDQQIPKKVHWIQRGDLDHQPGHVHLDNCPALEQEYKSSKPARDIYLCAKEATAKEQEALIREGMAALRTSYEALVVYELFGGVVKRFEERISIGLLPTLIWNEEVLIEIDENYARLSRYIEGHLHSDAMAEPLKLDMLIDEIEKFDALKNRISDLKKGKKH